MSSGHVRPGSEEDSGFHQVLWDHNFYRNGGPSDELIREFGIRVSQIRWKRIKQAYWLWEDLDYIYTCDGD